MLELGRVGPTAVELREGEQVIGHARWRSGRLCWGREGVTVALVEALSCREDHRADLWDYLTYLFQKEGMAAAKWEGDYLWFSKALQAAWEAAGAPEAEE